MKIHLHKFTNEEIEVLKKIPSITIYDENSYLSSENHATLILEGEVAVLKNEEPVILITPGYMIYRLKCKANKSCKVLQFIA